MPHQHCAMNILFRSSRCEGEIWEHSFLRDNRITSVETQNIHVNGLMMVLSISLMTREIGQKIKMTVSNPVLPKSYYKGSSSNSIVTSSTEVFPSDTIHTVDYTYLNPGASACFVWRD